MDDSGPKIRIGPPGGKESWTSLFVAVMGWSNNTFAYATRNMRSESWICPTARPSSIWGVFRLSSFTIMLCSP